MTFRGVSHTQYVCLGVLVVALEQAMADPDVPQTCAAKALSAEVIDWTSTNDGDGDGDGMCVYMCV